MNSASHKVLITCWLQCGPEEATEIQQERMIAWSRTASKWQNMDSYPNGVTQSPVPFAGRHWKTRSWKVWARSWCLWNNKLNKMELFDKEALEFGESY